MICHKGVTADQQKRAALKRKRDKEAKKKEDEEEKGRLAEERAAAMVALLGEYVPVPCTLVENESEVNLSVKHVPHCVSTFTLEG